jgi:DNA-binding beta-propeller fold protein YncE
MPHRSAACLASIAALVAASPALAAPLFERIAAFPVAQNLPEGTDPDTPTSAEIIAASGDGMTLIYSDSPNNAVGFVDITDAAAPAPLGSLAFDGEPTAVSVRDATAFVGVNTSPSFTEPSGRLAAVDIAGRAETASCDLGGQPDSVAVAPDGSFVAVAIENERDEEAGDGGLPQMPAGHVAIVPIADGALQGDAPDRGRRDRSRRGAPEDPEPELVASTPRATSPLRFRRTTTSRLRRRGALALPAGAADLEGRRRDRGRRPRLHRERDRHPARA